MMLRALREEVCRANRLLPAYGLVVWTSGNVSGRDPDSDLVVIKPSGVLFEDLTPENMVVVDLAGQVVEGDHGPSTDTLSHVEIYRHRPDLLGIVHTHSNYATAFAATSQSIPVCLTAIADEFGEAIPVTDYVPIGGREIGQEVLRWLHVSPAVLLKQHGVFTVGPTVEKALKAAVMVEDVAKTVWLALQLGPIKDLPAEEVLANYERYHTRYGTANASMERAPTPG